MAKPTTLTGRWLKLAKWAGGAGRLARKLKTGRWNVRAWCLGAIPMSKTSRNRVNAACDAAGVRRIYR
jgi:hypothetical protein